MKILLLDIETSPNVAHVWGLFNQNIGLTQLLDSGSTMCWAAKWLGKGDIFFRSTYHDGEKRMLEDIYDLLDRADAVVHYNGTKFDIPTLNKEFLQAGMPPPSTYKEIDLLQTARRKFRFASNKLDYVSKFLGFEGKVQHKGHELWIGCLNGNPEDWETMRNYNIQDVVELENVYMRFLPWIERHPNMAVYTDGTAPCCTNCGSTSLQRRGYAHTQVSRYRRYRCNDCGCWSRERVVDKEWSKAHANRLTRAI